MGVAGAQGGCEDEADLTLLQNVGSAVAQTGLGTGVGNERHAERSAVEIGSLARIANVELDMVGSFERKEIDIGCYGREFGESFWHRFDLRLR